MSDSVTFKNIDSLPKDARYREGAHGEVDVFDSRHQTFVRVDEGDKIVADGKNGYNVEKSDENTVTPAQEVFPEKNSDANEESHSDDVVTSTDVK